MDIPDEVQRAALRSAIGGVLFNVSNFPAKAQASLLAQDMAPLNDRLAKAILDSWLPGIVARARREALGEAAEAIRNNAGVADENGICEGVSNWPEASARTYSFAAHEAIEAVRALAEGDS